MITPEPPDMSGRGGPPKGRPGSGSSCSPGASPNGPGPLNGPGGGPPNGPGPGRPGGPSWVNPQINAMNGGLLNLPIIQQPAERLPLPSERKSKGPGTPCGGPGPSDLNVGAGFMPARLEEGGDEPLPYMFRTGPTPSHSPSSDLNLSGWWLRHLR